MAYDGKREEEEEKEGGGRRTRRNNPWVIRQDLTDRHEMGRDVKDTKPASSGRPALDIY